MDDQRVPIIRRVKLTRAQLEADDPALEISNWDRPLIFRFAKEQTYVRCQNGTKVGVLAQAGEFNIDFYPSAFKNYPASLYDVQIPEGMKTKDVLEGLPLLLIHELCHNVLDGMCSCILGWLHSG